MKKFSFSSNDLPQELSSEERARRWADAVGIGTGTTEIRIPDSSCFRSQANGLFLAGMPVIRTSASSIELHRTQARIKQDGADSGLFLITTSARPVGGIQFGREVNVSRGSAAFFVNNHVNETWARKGGGVVALVIPREQLTASHRDPENLGGLEVPAENEALRLLRIYLDALLSGSGSPNDVVEKAAAAHVVELANIALSTRSSEASISEPAALRAARRLDALRYIRAHFRNPRLDPEQIAGLMRVSVR